MEQVLLDAGAHVTPAWHHYDPGVPLEIVEANPIPAGMMVPDVPGSLNLRHPDACSALAAAAQAAGAEVVRGVSEVEVAPGARPEVSYRCQGTGEEIRARLVVGADGRNSVVRRQAGLNLERQAEVHMIAGLLLDGLETLPADRDFLAAEGDLFMAAFQQEGGRLRVYLCPGSAQRHRFSGPRGIEEFLRSTAFSCLPFGEELARATPAGPLATYPGDDSWIPEPYTHGVVLIGDAAGYNDPIIGQGLSISMRDARLVRDVVRAGDLTPGAFAGYGAERMERMRRLRAVATFMSAAFGEDCEDREARRARFFEMQANDPLMLGMLAAVFAGPDAGPPEAFDGRLLAALRGQEAVAAAP